MRVSNVNERTAELCRRATRKGTGPPCVMMLRRFEPACRIHMSEAELTESRNLRMAYMAGFTDGKREGIAYANELKPLRRRPSAALRTHPKE